MIYRFGAYELDPTRFRLARGGEEVSVEPQVFDVLKFLIENRERVVSRDDLIEAVWGGRIVSDATLSSRISAARHAVGDSGENQAVIRTVHKRGFRFVAELAAAPVEDSGPGQEKPSDAAPGHRQKVKFCTSRDGTRIAFATMGAGYPLVRAGHWLTHLNMTGTARSGVPCSTSSAGIFK